MIIEMRPLESITPYDRNPRQNDAAVDAVARSITDYGFRQPIVLDRDGVIVVGHTRYKAAMKLGLKVVPVHVAAELTEAQARSYRIADNATASIATWDDELLPAELRDLASLDNDIKALGFSPEELAQWLPQDPASGLTDPDAVPEPPAEASTKPGDLYILGEHRLLCGDSADAAHVDALMDGAPVHLLNTDPPYNVKVEPRSNNAIAAGLSSFEAGGGGTRKRPATHHQSLDLARHPGKGRATHKQLRAKDRPLRNDFVSDEAFESMLAAWFGTAARVLLPGHGFYVWGGYSNLGAFPAALAAAGRFLIRTRLYAAADSKHGRIFSRPACPALRNPATVLTQPKLYPPSAAP